MLDLAKQLIEQKSGSFNPGDFVDRYQLALKDLVQQKIRGDIVVSAPEVTRPTGANVIDLMAALRKSIEGNSSSSAPKTQTT